MSIDITIKYHSIFINNNGEQVIACSPLQSLCKNVLHYYIKDFHYFLQFQKFVVELHEIRKFLLFLLLISF